MARNCVPVYSKNADTKRERPIYHVSLAEANLLTTKDADGNSKALQVSKRHAPLQIQLAHHVTPDINSPCSINYKEMLANAGIGSISAIKHAQCKVSMWNVPSGRDRDLASLSV